MRALTVQKLAAEWEAEVAALVGGQTTPGSGNRMQARGDVGAFRLAVECKDTKHDSFQVTGDMLDEIASIAGTDADALAVLAVRMRAETGGRARRLAVIDLDALVDVLRAPPNLVPAAPQEQIRATARTPTLLR